MNLADLIPDADVLLALDPDELGLRILQVMRSSPAHLQNSNEFGTIASPARSDLTKTHTLIGMLHSMIPTKRQR